jgi:hypothetical protein
MYVLERLVQDIPIEVLNQLGDSVWIGPGFAPVVAGLNAMYGAKPRRIFMPAFHSEPF